MKTTPDVTISTHERTDGTVYRFNIGTPEGTRFLVQNTTHSEWNTGIEVDHQGLNVQEKEANHADR